MSGAEANSLSVSIPIPQGLKDLVFSIPGAPQYIDWWINLSKEDPKHLFIETALILFIIYILFKRPAKKKSKAESLPADVVDELVDEFQPEPLCPPLSKRAEMILSQNHVAENNPSTRVKLQGISTPVSNFASMDFLNMGDREDFKKAAHDALDKYGCGSCGPRGFYGTIDVHVFCEQAIAKFLKAEDAIIYSDATSTVASGIAAFANRADLLVVDELCNDSILTGVKLSRSKHYFFKHNDMEDLERVLKKVDEEDKRLKRKPQRRFIVIEGIYRNVGDIARYKQVIELKKQYKWRVFVDESNSFGVLGKTGRGITEHCEIPFFATDICVASMAGAMASVGGFCAGTHEVVEHQRLNGAGYVFSASQPPFTATAAQKALDILDEEHATLIPSLRRNCTLLHNMLTTEDAATLFTVPSSPESPIIHVQLAGEFQNPDDRLCEEETLREIVGKVLDEHDVLMVVSSYIDNPTKVSKGFTPPSLPIPSIRMVVQANHAEEDIKAAVDGLMSAAKQVLHQEDGVVSDAPTDDCDNDEDQEPKRYSLRSRGKK